MVFIKIAIFFVIIIYFSISTFALSATRNESPIRKDLQIIRGVQTSCTALSQNKECASVFKTVATIENATPNRSMILRNDSSFITADKYLIMGTEIFSSKEYEYCKVNLIKESTAEVQVCKRNCYQNSTWRPCIPKCCLWGESVKLDRNTGKGFCVPSNEPRYTWEPDIYDDEMYLQNLKHEDYRLGFNPHYYSVGNNIENTCKSVFIWHSASRFSFHMLQNGNVRWRFQTNKWFQVHNKPENHNKFCFDKIQDSDSDDQVLRICYSELVESAMKHRKLYAGLAFLSALFMFLLLMIYGFLAEEQNSHGWIQFLFFFSLFVFYFLEGIGLLVLPGDLQVKPICYILSVTHHFFFTLATTSLVTFSWDMFSTFWKMSPNAGQRKCFRKFYISAGISCSSAFVLVLCGVLMNLADSPYGPPYGLLFCKGTQWVVGKYIQGAFVIFSLVTLLSTIFIIYKHKAATKILIPDTRTFYKELFKVLLKLLIVQGIFWTCIMIIKFLRNYKDRSRYDHLLHIIYNSQSLFLFILFARDKRKLKSLEEKYPRFKALSDALCFICRRDIREIGEDRPLKTSRSKISDLEDK